MNSEEYLNGVKWDPARRKAAADAINDILKARNSGKGKGKNGEEAPKEDDGLLSPKGHGKPEDATQDSAKRGQGDGTDDAVNSQQSGEPEEKSSDSKAPQNDSDTEDKSQTEPDSDSDESDQENENSENGSSSSSSGSEAEEDDFESEKDDDDSTDDNGGDGDAEDDSDEDSDNESDGEGEESDENDESDGSDEYDGNPWGSSGVNPPTFKDRESQKGTVRATTRARTVSLAERTYKYGAEHNANKTVLSDLQAKTETLKSYTVGDLESMSDSDFDKAIASVLDVCDKIHKVNYSVDLDTRIKELKADRDTGQLQADIDKEVKANSAADSKIRQAEAQKYANASASKSMQQFKINLYRTIRDQIEMQQEEERTYSRINKRADDKGTVEPGSRLNNKPSKEIPNLYVYYDQSGSWGEDAIRRGNMALASLVDFVNRGELDLKIFYFANHIAMTPDHSIIGLGTDAWPEIIQSIQDNHAQNVVLMTDSDMWLDAKKSNGVIVPGCVWLIWKNPQTQSDDIAEKLRGKQGTHEYTLT